MTSNSATYMKKNSYLLAYAQHCMVSDILTTTTGVAGVIACSSAVYTVQLWTTEVESIILLLCRWSGSLLVHYYHCSLMHFFHNCPMYKKVEETQYK